MTWSRRKQLLCQLSHHHCPIHIESLIQILIFNDLFNLFPSYKIEAFEH